MADKLKHRSLQLLCLHGHGSSGETLCKQFEASLFRSLAAPVPENTEEGIDVQCRCIDAPFSEPSRHKHGRQWWRYDNDGTGDRPQDWAEAEVAATRLAEELATAPVPCDGVLGFSQGAEMVHALAVLAHRDDPRFGNGSRLPRFGISLSGAVNPGHFEAPGCGGPPLGCQGPHAPPYKRELRLPMLFMADFAGDKWYSTQRFMETLALYKDVTQVRHSEGHTVPSPAAGPQAITAVRDFLVRFCAEGHG